MKKLLWIIAFWGLALDVSAQQGEVWFLRALRLDFERHVDSAQICYLRAFEQAKSSENLSETLEVGSRAAAFLWKNHKLADASSVQKQIEQLAAKGEKWQAWYPIFAQYAAAVRNRDQAQKDALWQKMQEQERAFLPKNAEEQLRKAYILLAMATIANGLKQGDLMESYILSAQRSVENSTQTQGLTACEIFNAKAVFNIHRDMKSATISMRRLQKIYNPKSELAVKYERTFYTFEFFHALNTQDTTIILRAFASIENKMIQKMGENHPITAQFYCNVGIVYKDVWRRYIHDNYEGIRRPALLRAHAYMLRGLAIYEGMGEGVVAYAQEASNGYKQLAYMLQEDFRGNTPEEQKELRDRGELYFTRAYYYLLPNEVRAKAQKLPMGHFIDFSSSDIYTLNDQAVLHVLHGLTHLYASMGEGAYESWKRVTTARKQLAARYVAASQNDSDFSKTSLELALIYGDISRYYSDLATKNEKNRRQWVDSTIYYSEQTLSNETRRSQNLANTLQQSGVPAELAKPFLEKKKALQLLIDQRSLAQSAQDETQINALNQQIIAQQMALDQLSQEIAQKYPKYAQSILHLSAPSISDIQKNLDPHSACLILSHVVYPIYVCKDTVIIHQFRPNIGKTRLVSAQNLRFERFLKNPDFSASPDSILADKKAFLTIMQEEYERFMGGLLPYLKQRNIRHLIIVGGQGFPHDLLLCTPATIDQPYGEMDFLVKHFSIQYINSLTLWQQARENKSSSNGKMLGFAPLYAPERVHTARNETLSLTRRMLSPLKGADDEIKALAERYWGDFFFGEQAHESQFKNATKEKYAVIHLAMHGLLNYDAPALSSLAFAETMNDSTEDNFLHAYEIAALHIQSQLLVLSACETGIGQNQSGEGTLSLARYFLLAGTPALIATRWQVNDQTTGMLMQLFYEELYKGKTIAEALHQAKVNYLANAKGDAQHPFFWAAPFCVGYAETPVYIAPKDWQKRYWLWAGALAGTVLLCGLGLWFWRRKVKSEK